MSISEDLPAVERAIRRVEAAPCLEEIIASEVFTADQLPNPTDEERKPPRPQTEASQDMLYSGLQ